MKNDDPRLNRNRLYEIVDLPKDNAWHTPLDDPACIIGTIVSPTNPGEVRVVRAPPNRTFALGHLYIGKYATLRPLSQKDQRKINANQNVSG